MLKRPRGILKSVRRIHIINSGQQMMWCRNRESSTCLNRLPHQTDQSNVVTISYTLYFFYRIESILEDHRYLSTTSTGRDISVSIVGAFLQIDFVTLYIIL